MTNDGLLSASFRISGDLLVTAERGRILINESGHDIFINPPEVDSLIRALQECKRFLPPKKTMEESKRKDGELLPPFHLETDWGSLIGRQVELANGEVWTINKYTDSGIAAFLPLELIRRHGTLFCYKDGSSTYPEDAGYRIIKVLAPAK